MKESIEFELNGKPVRISTNPDNLLLWVLRNELDHTGTKFGCGEGYCGACTVLLDDEPVRSCMITVKDVAGSRILTVEGLARDDSLHVIQKAFMAHDAFQCGYCTPGMIMNAFGLLLKNPDPSRQEIIEAMEDNLCRCGTYGRIIGAVQEAAAELRGEVKI